MSKKRAWAGVRGGPGGGEGTGQPGSIETFARHHRASHQAKKSENKTPDVFFKAAFDFDAPGLQNTAHKGKNKLKLEF